MKILLVSYMRLSGFDLLMKIPSLGLASIAAHLDRQYCSVKISDLLIASDRSRSYFHRLLREYKPDVIGFSVITSHYFEALELARMAKEHDQDTRIVFGGYHPTLDYDSILRKDEAKIIDFIIRGEAELSFNRLIRALSGNLEFSAVTNLSYREGGTIVHNPDHGLLDLDKIRLPDRSSRIKIKGSHMYGYPTDIVELSRGCPYNCSFCSSPSMYGRSYRKFSIDRILADLRSLRKRGIKGIFVADHNVTAAPEWYGEVCEAIIDAGLSDLKFAVQASVSGIKQSPGLAEIMAKSGVEWALLGIESVSRSSLEFMNKDQSRNDDASEVVKELKERGMIVMGTFVAGCPDDTEETIRANYEYAKKIGIDVASFLTLTPYPNTPVRDELVKQNLVTNLHDYSIYDLWHANVRTKHLSADQLFELVMECNARYLIDSGSIWRLAKRFPAYIPGVIVKELIKNPRETMAYFKGLRNRPISLKRIQNC